MTVTTIRLSHPGGASLTYRVRLDQRYGMHTQESYDAEVARIIAMGEAAGADLAVTTES